MKRRFILYRRKLGGTFYVEDTQTRKQENLGTKDRLEAETLLNARNEANRQPMLNLQLAKAYLAGTDSGFSVSVDARRALRLRAALPPSSPRLCRRSLT